MKQGASRLLLSGYDMGASLNPSTVQPGLDFSRRVQELVSGRKMGDDVFRALSAYLKVRDAILFDLRKNGPLFHKS